MKPQPSQRKPWRTIVFIILGLTFASLLLAGAVGFFVETPQSGNVAVISIRGTISEDPDSSWTADGTAARDIVPLIKKANEDSAVRAILVDINSPGGSAVASDEIGQALSNVSKPTVALIHEVGASGAYWIATSTDHIIANRMSITGSIGVIGSYLEFPDLLSRYNVTYRRLVAGKYKDMGTPFREMSNEEQQLFQSVLDDLRWEFVSTVATNRHLPKDKVDVLATGQFYTGKQALNAGLVDELGGESEAIAHLGSKINTTVELVPFEVKRSIFDKLAGLISQQSFSMGEGIGSGLVKQDTGVPQLH